MFSVQTMRPEWLKYNVSILQRLACHLVAFVMTIYLKTQFFNSWGLFRWWVLSQMTADQRVEACGWYCTVCLRLQGLSDRHLLVHMRIFLSQTTALTSLPALSYAFAAWLVFMVSLQLMLHHCFYLCPLQTANLSPPLYYIISFHSWSVCIFYIFVIVTYRADSRLKSHKEDVVKEIPFLVSVFWVLCAVMCVHVCCVDFERSVICWTGYSSCMTPERYTFSQNCWNGWN